MSELTPAAVGGDLSGEQAPLSGAQMPEVIVHPGPEEREPDLVGSVGNRNLKHRAASSPQGSLPGGGNLGDDRDLLTLDEAAQFGEFPAGRITTRIVPHQVFDGVQIQCIGEDLGGPVAEYRAQRVVQGGHSPHPSVRCTPCGRLHWLNETGAIILLGCSGRRVGAGYFAEQNFPGCRIGCLIPPRA